jgi:hypothetical protein
MNRTALLRLAVLASIVTVGLTAGCTAQRGCAGAACQLSYASRAFPVPGSPESRAALAAGEAKVDEVTRREGAGHVTWEPSAGPGHLGLPSVSYRPGTTRTSQEAAAKERLEAVVGPCMAEQSWIPCNWEDERSEASMDLRGPGWVCRRVRPDDPQP